MYALCEEFSVIRNSSGIPLLSHYRNFGVMQHSGILEMHITRGLEIRQSLIKYDATVDRRIHRSADEWSKDYFDKLEVIWCDSGLMN